MRQFFLRKKRVSCFTYLDDYDVDDVHTFAITEQKMRADERQKKRLKKC